MKKITDQITGKEITAYFRTPHNFNFKQVEKDQETTSDEDLTVPDLSYSVREILEKYTRGIDPGVAQKPQYDDNQSFDAVNPLRNPMFDLSDISQTAKHERETVSTEEKPSNGEATAGATTEATV